jgi:hypothetical protein
MRLRPQVALRMRTGAIVAPIVGWILTQLQLVQPLAWDEVEFFRATKWIAEGLVPYRDYWEHHTPLQWILFAPAARLLGKGAGAQAVLTMRWVQLIAWVGLCTLLLMLLRQLAISPLVRWVSLALLLANRSFIAPAIQYRVDTVGNLAFFAGLMLLVRRRWIAFGAVMSIAVLANMRLAPIVCFVALIGVFWCEEESRWRLQAGSLAMVPGVLAVVLVFIGALFAFGAWGGFVDGVIRYNAISNRLAAPLEGDALTPLLLAPFRGGDIAAIALWVLAIVGTLYVLRDVREPSLAQILSLAFIVSLVVVALPAVQYDYHLQTSWLLMVPLTAIAIERLAKRFEITTRIAMGAAIVSVALNFALLATPTFGEAISYQNEVMLEADRRTAHDSKVWDGSGYALRRAPAYRYWFLPAGVRLMAERGLLQKYEIEHDPPAAIIYSYRVHNWLLAFPDVQRYALHHYVPLYRNLWVPGLSAPLSRGRTRLYWRSAGSGSYKVWASELLANHPWFEHPMVYGLIEGERATQMKIPLQRLPQIDPAAMEWIVDGIPQPRGTTTLRLHKGSSVELRATVTADAGVFVVPDDVSTLCEAPASRFVF